MTIKAYGVKNDVFWNSGMSSENMEKSVFCHSQCQFLLYHHNIGHKMCRKIQQTKYLEIMWLWNDRFMEEWVSFSTLDLQSLWLRVENILQGATLNHENRV